MVRSSLAVAGPILAASATLVFAVAPTAGVAATGRTTPTLAQPASATTGRIRVPYTPRMRIKMVFSWKKLSGGRTLLEKVTIAKMPSYAIMTAQCRGRRCPVGALDVFGSSRHRLIRFLTGKVFAAGSALSLLGTEGTLVPEKAIFVFRAGRLPKVLLR